MVRAAFAPHFTLEHVLVDGDKAAVMWTNRGTHVAEWFGVPPTGKSFAINGIDIFRLAEGRLAEHWDVVDVFGLMTQLGAIPSAGAFDPATDQTERNKATARRMVDEVVNGRRLELLDEILAPEFVDHTAPPGVPPTRDGAKDLFRMFLDAFPDLHVTIQDVVAQADTVVQRTRATGTMKGEFMGMPSTGRSATWEQIHILRFADGREIEHWTHSDQLGLLAQLGLSQASAEPVATSR